MDCSAISPANSIFMNSRSPSNSAVIALTILVWVGVQPTELDGRSRWPGNGSFRWPDTTRSSATIENTESVEFISNVQNAPSFCNIKCCKCLEGYLHIECLRSPECQELTIGNEGIDATRLPAEVQIVNIQGFSRLKISKQSLDSCTRLRNITISNVGLVEIERHGLSRPQCTLPNTIDATAIYIQNCSISALRRWSFIGGWSEIHISRSNVDAIEFSSFSNLSCLRTFSLENSIVNRVRTNSFANAKTDHLYIKGNELKLIENYGFHLKVIREVVISENKITELQSEAFVLHNPNVFNFKNNSVKNVYQHAFQLGAERKINIELNSFGYLMRHVFHHVNLIHKDNKMAKLTLKDNAIVDFNKDALRLNESLAVSTLQISRLNLQMDCDCSLSLIVDNLVTLDSEDQESDGATKKTIINEAVNCRQPNNDFTSFTNFVLTNCDSEVNEWSVGAIVSFSLVPILLALIIIVGIVLYCKLGKRQRNEQAQKHSTFEMAGSWVVPEPRIYVEREVNLEEEFAIPLEVEGSVPVAVDLLD